MKASEYSEQKRREREEAGAWRRDGVERILEESKDIPPLAGENTIHASERKLFRDKARSGVLLPRLGLECDHCNTTLFTDGGVFGYPPRLALYCVGCGVSTTVPA